MPPAIEVKYVPWNGAHFEDVVAGDPGAWTREGQAVGGSRRAETSRCFEDGFLRRGWGTSGRRRTRASARCPCVHTRPLRSGAAARGAGHAACPAAGRGCFREPAPWRSRRSPYGACPRHDLHHRSRRERGSLEVRLTSAGPDVLNYDRNPDEVSKQSPQRTLRPRRHAPTREPTSTDVVFGGIRVNAVPGEQVAQPGDLRL